MAQLILFILIFLSLLIANALTRWRDETLTRLFFTFLFLLNLPLLIIGLLFAVLPSDQLNVIQSAAGLLLADPVLFGLILQLTAIWGILVSVRASRHALFRQTRLDPESPVHGLALVSIGYLVGNVALIFTQGGFAQIAATADSATIVDIVSPAIIFVVLGAFGVGLLIRRDWSTTRIRLGLERPTWRQLGYGLRWVGGLIVLQWLVGASWAALNPVQAEELSQVNDLLLANVDTVWEWALLAISAGVGEEILFRGALQPLLGLPLTAVIFALGHVQYGLTPITVLVFVLGLVLGYIRQQTNTTVAIFVHASYNFILGLLALSVPYLEQFAEQVGFIVGWNW